MRLTTGLILKDDDDNVELPSSYTKRTLYSRWCWDRGWDIKPNGGAGSYGRVQDHSKRVNKPDSLDENLWPVGSVSREVCSKSTFCRFWDEHYKTLVIKKSSHDTCSVCYLFTNALNGLKRREIQEGRRETREDRLLSGVRENELDEDESGQIFELDNTRDPDEILV